MPVNAKALTRVICQDGSREEATKLLDRFQDKNFEEIDTKRLSKSEICKKYDIPNSTMSTFLKNRTKVEVENSSANRSRKRLREAAYSDIDEAFMKHVYMHIHIYIHFWIITLHECRSNNKKYC